MPKWDNCWSQSQVPILVMSNSGWSETRVTKGSLIGITCEHPLSNASTALSNRKWGLSGKLFIFFCTMGHCPSQPQMLSVRQNIGCHWQNYILQKQPVRQVPFYFSRDANHWHWEIEARTLWRCGEYPTYKNYKCTECLVSEKNITLIWRRYFVIFCWSTRNDVGILYSSA